MCRAVVDEHDILRRIKLLQIRDDQKDGLMAEFHRRRQDGTLKQFEKVLDLPWGVFCTPNPYTGADIFSPVVLYDGPRQLILDDINIHVQSQNAKPPSLLFINDLGYDKDLTEKLKKLLGRPVETVRFSANSWKHRSVQGSEGVMGCVMKAIRRAGCCNPVIILKYVNDIKNKAAKQIVLDLIDHKNSANFVDYSIKVPFDLSNVLFLVEGDESDSARVMSSRIEARIKGKAHDELHAMRNFQWMNDSFRPYLNKRLPFGGATGLSVVLNTEYAEVWLVQSSFSEQRLIVNNNTESNKLMVDIAFKLCVKYFRSFGIPADRLKNQFTVVTACDGYSCGCAIFLSLLSLFTNRRVRHDSTVTGMLTDRGKVKSVASVIEKTYAAYMCGIRRIVLSKWNREDVEVGMCERLKNEMEFVYIDNVHELVREMMEVDDS